MFSDSIRSQSWFPILIPLGLMLAGGILVDLLPISGAFWMVFYLAAAFLAGWMLPRRQAFWVVLIATIVTMVGTAIVASDQSHVIGGPVPILETLFVVTLPMIALILLGGSRKRRRMQRSRLDELEDSAADMSVDGSSMRG